MFAFPFVGKQILKGYVKCDTRMHDKER